MQCFNNTFALYQGALPLPEPTQPTHCSHCQCGTSNELVDGWNFTAPQYPVCSKSVVECSFLTTRYNNNGAPQTLARSYTSHYSPTLASLRGSVAF